MKRELTCEIMNGL